MRVPLFRLTAAMLAIALPTTPVLAQSLPAKAEITYQGTHRAVVTRRQRPNQRQQPLIDLGRFLRPQAGASADGDRYEGAVTIKLRIDGAAAYADMSGTGGFDTVSVTGIYDNGRCRLTDGSNMAIYEGTCDARSFSGTITSGPRNTKVIDGHFDTRATAMVDVSDRDARAAAAQRVTDAQTAERRRAIEARRAVLKPLCDAHRVSACVEMDTLGQP